MIFSDFDIILSETIPFIFAYAGYALAVCSALFYAAYRSRQSRPQFRNLLFRNTAVFFTALSVFSLSMIGFWYGLRISGSETAFAWSAAFLLFGSVLGVSILMQHRTGIILKNPVLYTSLSAILLSLPLITAAVFIAMLSSADFRY